jgi:hypothetical protein
MKAYLKQFSRDHDIRNDFVAALVAMTAVFFSIGVRQKKSRARKSPA